MKALLLVLVTLLAPAARAQDTDDAGPWLTLDGAGGIAWGSADQPVDATPRTRDLYLPDSGFIGLTTTAKPDDLEIPAPAGARRFLRYVGGQLVDAWELKQGSIPVSDFARIGDVEFSGAVLGPTLSRDEAGWVAVGNATSWRVRDRTVLYWKDRASNVEILVSRASPSNGYGVRRETALQAGIPSHIKPIIKGDMSRWVQPRKMELSGCFDNSPKPVEAEISVRWDAKGQVTRIRASADQAAADLTPCVAGAISDLTALPGQQGSFSVIRVR
jgi:hypothetical protein